MLTLREEEFNNLKYKVIMNICRQNRLVQTINSLERFFSINAFCEHV